MTPVTRNRTDRRDTRAQERGFSLIETLVAMMLFSVGALSLAAVLPLGMNRVTNSSDFSRASAIGSDLSERLLATPYASEALDAGDHDDDGNPYDSIYYASWTVEDNQPIADCKRITVDVRWPRATSTKIVRVVLVKPLSGG